jgi:hypothetical protein
MLLPSLATHIPEQGVVRRAVATGVIQYHQQGGIPDDGG